MDLLATREYDLVFSDNDLPTVDEGKGLLRHVGEHYPTVGRYLTSGRFLEHEAAGLGLDGYFQKPYNPAEVCDRFEVYLESKQK